MQRATMTILYDSCQLPALFDTACPRQIQNWFYSSSAGAQMIVNIIELERSPGRILRRSMNSVLKAWQRVRVRPMLLSSQYFQTSYNLKAVLCSLILTRVSTAHTSHNLVCWQSFFGPDMGAQPHQTKQQPCRFWVTGIFSECFGLM